MKFREANSNFDARINSDGKGRFRVRVYLSSGDGYSSEMSEEQFREFCNRIGADCDILSEAASQAVTVVNDIQLSKNELREIGFTTPQ